MIIRVTNELINIRARKWKKMYSFC